MVSHSGHMLCCMRPRLSMSRLSGAKPGTRSAPSWSAPSTGCSRHDAAVYRSAVRPTARPGDGVATTVQRYSEADRRNAMLDWPTDVPRRAAASTARCPKRRALGHTARTRATTRTALRNKSSRAEDSQDGQHWNSVISGSAQLTALTHSNNAGKSADRTVNVTVSSVSAAPTGADRRAGARTHTERHTQRTQSGTPARGASTQARKRNAQGHQSHRSARGSSRAHRSVAARTNPARPSHAAMQRHGISRCNSATGCNAAGCISTTDATVAAPPRSCEP